MLTHANGRAANAGNLSAFKHMSLCVVQRLIPLSASHEFLSTSVVLCNNYYKHS